MKTRVKKLAHKMTLLLLALTISMSSIGMTPAHAEETEELSRSFTDVSINWSYKYISKLALLGIIEGRGDGVFAPNDLVTQQEVLIMAVKMMGVKEEEIERAQADVLPEELETAEWAEGYVSTAIRKGLIQVPEELEAVKQHEGETDAAWGTWPASREWVAKMTIRAIGKDEQANLLADQDVQFKDAGDVTDGFAGYINAAVQLDVVSGMPGDVFKPTDTVTRAQMAVFLSRGEQYMPELSARVLQGTVTDLTNERITLQLDDGETISLDLHSTAEFFSHAINDEPISAADVKRYDEVYVIHHAGDAYYIEVTNDEVHVESVHGMLLELNREVMEVVINVDGEEQTFSLSDLVTIVDQDGRGLSWSKLAKHSIVKLTQTGSGTTAKVMEVVLLEAPVNKQSNGTFVAYDEANGMLTVVDESSEQEETYLLAIDAVLRYGERKLTIDEFNMEDEISFLVEDSVIMTIELVDPIEPLVDLVSGEVRGQVTDVVTIINEQGEPEAFVVAENVAFVLAGRDDPSADDIWVGDQVTLSVDAGNRKVNKIEVHDRSIEEVSGAEIVSFHEESLSFFIWMPNMSQSHIFKVDSTTKMDQKTGLRIEEMKELFPEGTKVNMKFTKDQLIEINRADGFVGEITHIDTTERTITMQIEHYGEFQFDYHNSTDYETGKENAKISDLRAGDHIEVHMHASNNYASQIDLIYTDMYHVTDVNVDHSILYLTHPLGDSIKLELSSSLRLLDEHGEWALLPDVTLYQPVSVSFKGNEIQEARVTTVDRGQVQELDKDSFVLLKAKDEQEQVMFADIAAVYRSGSHREESFEDIGTHDRIEVSTDADGNRWIVIMQEENKTFYEYDHANKQVLFRRTTLGEKNSYPIHPDLVVYESGVPISVNALTDRDSITVYYLDGHVVRIDKR